MSDWLQLKRVALQHLRRARDGVLIPPRGWYEVVARDGQPLLLGDSGPRLKHFQVRLAYHLFRIKHPIREPGESQEARP